MFKVYDEIFVEDDKNSITDLNTKVEEDEELMKTLVNR